jgi:hypothetical protein
MLAAAWQCQPEWQGARGGCGSRLRPGPGFLTEKLRVLGHNKPAKLERAVLMAVLACRSELVDLL